MNWQEFWCIVDSELYLADIDVLMYLGVDDISLFDGTPEFALEKVKFADSLYYLEAPKSWDTLVSNCQSWFSEQEIKTILQEHFGKGAGEQKQYAEWWYYLKHCIIDKWEQSQYDNGDIDF